MNTNVTFLDRQSDCAPALAMFNALLVMLWRDANGAMNSSVYSTALGWSAPASVAVMASAPPASAPALAVFRGRLCAAWVGTDGTLYHSTCGPDLLWTAPVALAGEPIAGQSPALTATANRLYLAFTAAGTGGHVNHPVVTWMHEDGVWAPASAQQELTQFAMDGAPAIVALGEEIHLLWRGIPPDDGYIFESISRDGTTWSAQTSPISGVAGDPTAVAYQGGIQLVASVGASGGVASWTRATGWGAIAAMPELLGEVGVCRVCVYDDATTASLVVGATLPNGVMTATFFNAPTTVFSPFVPFTVGVGLEAPATLAVAPDGSTVAVWWTASGGQFSVQTEGTWSAPASLPPLNLALNTAPNLLPWKDRLLLVVGVAGSPLFGYSTFREGSWTAFQTASALDNQAHEAVSAVVFQDTLYVAWARVQGQTLTYVTGTLDGDSIMWSAVSGFNASSSGTPALAVLGDQLMMTWKGFADDTSLYWTSVEGLLGTFQPQKLVPTIRTTASPALGELGDGLYLVYADATGQGLSVAMFQQNRWVSAQPIATSQLPPATAFRPIALSRLRAASQNTLCLTSVMSDGSVGISQLTVPVVVDAVLSQDYRIEKRVKVTGSGAQLLPVALADDAVALVLGEGASSAIVWEDPHSDTGFSSSPLGLAGAPLAAATTSDGRLVVFSPTAEGFAFVVENTPEASPRWLPAQTVPMAGTVSTVAARTLGGQLCLAVLTEVTGGWTLSLEVGWDPSAPAAPSVVFPDPLLSAAADWGLFSWGPCVVSYNGVIALWAQGSAFNEQVLATISPTAAAMCLDSSATTQVFVTQSSGAAPVWLGGTTLEAPAGVTFGPAQPTATLGGSLAAQLDGQQTLHVFAIGSDASLYHWSASQTGSETPPWSAPLPLVRNVSSVVSLADGDGHVHVFLTTQKNEVMHIWQTSSGDWAGSPLAVESGGSVVETFSYAMDVGMVGLDGNLLRDVPVTLQTQGPVALRVNGITQWCDTSRPVTVNTDAAGRLSILQTALGLSAEPVQISSPWLAGPILLSPSLDVELRMRTLSADEVLAAKDARGNLLLPGDDPNTRTRNARQLTDSVQSLMLTAPDATAGLSALMQRGPRRPGVRQRVLPGTVSVPTTHSFAFQLDLRDPDALAHEQLSHLQARALQREVVAEGKTWTAIQSGLADVWQSIKSGASQLVRVVIDVVAGVADVVVKFVSDGVDYVFEGVIDSLGQVLDLVQGVWKRYNVAVTRVFEWLGRVFDWGSILRTQQAVAWSIQQMLELTTIATSGLQVWVHNGIHQGRHALADVVAQLQVQLGGTTVGNVLAGSPRDASSEREATNQLLLQATLQRGSRTRPRDPADGVWSPPGGATDTDPMKRFEHYGRAQSESTAYKVFQSVIGARQRDMNSLLQFGGAEVASAVGALAVQAFDGVDHAAKGFFDSVQLSMSTFSTQINAEWEIPYVSAVFAHVTRADSQPDGCPLTALNLVALLAAIPSSALYTAVNGKPWLADDAALQSFQQHFTAHNIAVAAGLLAPLPGVRTEDPTQDEKDGLQTLFSGFSFVYGIVEAAVDGLSRVEGTGTARDESFSWERLLGVTDILLAAGQAATSVPYSSFEKTKRWHAAEIANWGISIALPCANLVAMVWNGKLARFAGKFANVIYSLVFSVGAGICALLIDGDRTNGRHPEPDPAGTAQNFIAPVGSAFKCLLITKLPVPRGIVMGLDVVVWTCVAGINQYRLREDIRTRAHRLASAPAARLLTE